MVRGLPMIDQLERNKRTKVSAASKRLILPGDH
jgi:hypothetical protein